MDIKSCVKLSCCWENRYELLGIILLIIATSLTIIAWDSFGIVAMFVVGLVLIGHKHFCYIGCHSKCHDHSDVCESHVCSEDGKKHASKK